MLTARNHVAAWALALGCVVAHSGTLSERARSCAVGAATYHRVNAEVLMAILVHESGGRAETVVKNSNGSVDVGLAGINSVHFNDLYRAGVAPADLLDECVSAYVGAWTYSKKVFKYGNTWQAIGAYHSETPYYNQRYQILIYNTMISLGFIAGGKLSAPPLRAR